jgi:hypothetical protein
MDRQGANTWVIAVLAIAVGFLAALLIVGGNDDEKSAGATTTSTQFETGTTGPSTVTVTTSTQAAAPQAQGATPENCINLWNQQNNRANQTFLVTIMSQQPVRVHVGATTDVPPQCLVTVVANDGKAYVFPEGGGTTFPYATAVGATDAGTLPPAQKTSNALEQRDGTLSGR